MAVSDDSQGWSVAVASWRYRELNDLWFTLCLMNVKCKRALKYTSVTQSLLSLILLMYVRTIQHLNYGGQEIKNKQKRLAVCDSNTPVPLKQGQGHQNWYESEDPKQGYDNEKFEKPRSNSLRKESQQ